MLTNQTGRNGVGNGPLSARSERQCSPILYMTQSRQQRDAVTEVVPVYTHPQQAGCLVASTIVP